MGQIDTRQMQPMNIQPFIWPDLPSVSVAEPALAKLLPAQTAHIPIESDNINLALQVPCDFTSKPIELMTQFEIGNYNFVVMHNRSLLDYLADQAGYSSIPTDLPEDVLGLITELIVAPLAHPLEVALQGSLQVARTQLPDASRTPTHSGIPISVEIPDANPEPLWLMADIPTLKRIIELVMHHSEVRRHTSFPSLSIPIRILGPECSLQQDEIDALKVGDGILFEQPWAANLAQRAIFADHLTANLQFTGGELRLATSLTSITRRNAHMPNIDDLSNASTIDLNEMPIDVSIELSRTKTTLEEIASLTTGSIVPFDSEFSQQIKLLANSTEFATGELVKLNNKIAVRIINRY